MFISTFEDVVADACARADPTLPGAQLCEIGCLRKVKRKHPGGFPPLRPVLTHVKIRQQALRHILLHLRKFPDEGSLRVFERLYDSTFMTNLHDAESQVNKSIGVVNCLFVLWIQVSQAPKVFVIPDRRATSIGKRSTWSSEMNSSHIRLL